MNTPGMGSPSPAILQKWHFYNLWCQDIPSDKFSLCVCPTDQWFVFLSSAPPPFKKRAQFACQFENFELTFLKHTSFLDTCDIKLFNDNRVEQALADPQRCLGPMTPTKLREVRDLVQQNTVLTKSQISQILR